MVLSTAGLELAAWATARAAWMPSALCATLALPSAATLTSLPRRGPTEARAPSDLRKTCHPATLQLRIATLVVMTLVIK